MNPSTPRYYCGIKHGYPSPYRGHSKPATLKPTSSQALPLRSIRPKEDEDGATSSYLNHSDGKRINTDLVFTSALKKQYPELDLVVVPEYSNEGSQCNLLTFAGAGYATLTPIQDKGDLPSSLEWTVYLPPARRMDGNKGYLGETVVFGKFLYQWEGEEFIVYLVDGRDGSEPYPEVKNYYILTTNVYKADQLVLTVGSWASDLHNEVWVFDQGFFEKDRELRGYEEVAHNSFESRQTYARLGVPWKRGIIYHGPPGDGKTISINFLNEVDGLKENDGIFIIASTNHLELLDPDISKRPSRFDRKYYFPDPNIDQRDAYCHFWQEKLRPNKDIEFPDKLCRAIAEITDKFSFAYIQEAFVATLLAIARRSKAKPTIRSSAEAWVLVSDDFGSAAVSDEGDLDKLELWVEMKKQAKFLCECMGDEESA
ncbi:hypothetical protein CDV36_015982 [Fusarium kuroshium]|uniref:ATPase AAA-type core domain-containing protein n=2 Tax=Fusarium solani species complex TaxID=232080 RepID=A0A3M2R3A5_9HYPO|nr:hypothetical protein CDV36_015982 [Fusarium kuroshium]RSL56178.1 hypothetical protein CEP51_014433 [Fusarium floridanum]